MTARAITHAEVMAIAQALRNLGLNVTVVFFARRG